MAASPQTPRRSKLPPKKTGVAAAPKAKAPAAGRALPAVAPAKAPDDEMQPVPPNTVLLRLVGGAVTSRIRHRALLDVLASGSYDYERYVERFKDLRERDYQALFAQYMLKKADFNRLFGEWSAEDLERYRADRVIEPKPTAKPRRKKSS